MAGGGSGRARPWQRALAAAQAWWQGRRRAGRPRYAALYQAGGEGLARTWLAGLLTDPVVCARSGLRPATRVTPSGARGVIVTGLELPYRHFVALRKPEPWRAIYILQDPRAVWLERFEAIRSGGARDAFGRAVRDALDERSSREALRYLLGRLEERGSFRRARSWLELGASEEAVRVFRFEQIARAPLAATAELLAWCGVELSQRSLASLLQRHPVPPRTRWRERLAPELLELFDRRLPGLLETLGYA